MSEFSRREFFKKAAVAAMTIPALSACQIDRQPAPKPTAEPQLPTPLPVVDEKLQAIGKDLASQRDFSGRLYTENPYVRDTVKFLANELPIENLVPLFARPIHFYQASPQSSGEFNLTPNTSPDTRRINAILPNGSIHYADWLPKGGLTASVGLSVDIEADPFKQLSTMTKEISQILDFKAYNRAYLNYIKSLGVKFEFNNPANIPTNEDEIMLNSAWVIDAMDRGHREVTFLKTFIDLGSGLRVGSILFANWYVNAIRRNPNLPETGWLTTGLDYSGFMQDKGLLRIQGNSVYWVKGAAPAIESEELFRLVEERSGILRPTFS